MIEKEVRVTTEHAGLLHDSKGLTKTKKNVPMTRQFLHSKKVLNAYIMSQCGLCSSFGTSLALGEADGVSGPVIHQFV